MKSNTNKNLPIPAQNRPIFSHSDFISVVQKLFPKSEILSEEKVLTMKAAGPARKSKNFVDKNQTKFF